MSGAIRIGSGAVIAAAIVLGLGGVARSADRPGAAPPRQITIASVSVTLPDSSDEAFPAGAGAEAINANCRACHSPAMVLTQPPLKPEAWRKIIHKMQDVYKASVADGAEDQILLYLRGRHLVTP